MAGVMHTVARGRLPNALPLPFTWLTPPGPPALCLLGSSSRKPSWKPSQGVRLGVPRGTCLIPGLSLQIMTVSPVTFDMSMTWVCHGCLWNARMNECTTGATKLPLPAVGHTEVPVPLEHP